MLKNVLYSNVTVFDVIVAFSVLLIAGLLAKTLAMAIRRHFRERLERHVLDLIVKITQYAIMIMAIIAVLPMLGFNLSGLMVAGGVTGIVVGFASQNIVSNLISGIFLMIERPIKIGQVVEVGDTAGMVENISIMSTVIKGHDGLYVRIPNAGVFTSKIVNTVVHPVRRFEYAIGIRYCDDADKAVGIIRAIVDAHPMTLVNPEPQVFVDSLGESSVNIIARIWGPSADWYGTKMELLWKIKIALEKEGIEMPFPQRTHWFAGPLKTEGGPQGVD